MIDNAVKEKISVIVPVYNVEKYIMRCIDSILAQSFCEYELILVDDGSTDSSGAICDNYSKKDNRIIVIHQYNQGQAVARNRALDIASGDYIVFVDSDDYIHPKMFETLMDYARHHDVDIIRYHYYKGNDRNISWEPIKSTCKEYSTKEYLRNSILKNLDGIWVLWDKMFKRACFEEIRLPEGRIFEDNATVYKLLYNAETVLEVEAYLYYYYQNPQSTMNQVLSEKKADWLLVLEEMAEFFLKMDDYEISEHFVISYLKQAPNIYNGIYAIAPDSSRLFHIKRIIKQYIKAYKRKHLITIRNYPQDYAIIYPLYSRLYWKLVNIFKKMRG